MFEIGEGLEALADDAILSSAQSETVNDSDFFKNLSEQQKTAILTSAKAKSFGNNSLVDEKGSAIGDFKTIRGELINAINTYRSLKAVNMDGIEQIELDGVAHKINEKGELVDAENKVVRTAWQVRQMILENTDDNGGGDAATGDLKTIVSKVAELTGFELVDANGKPIEFEETPEGVAKAISHITREQTKQMVQQSLETLFTSMPEIEELYEYIQTNKTAKGFVASESYNDVTIDSKNKEQHMEIITKANIARGMSPERAALNAKWAVEDGKGFDNAKEDLAYLQELKNSKYEARRQQAIDDENNAKNARLAEIEAINNAISKGMVDDIVIPEFIKVKNDNGTISTLSRQDFAKFVMEPDETGVTGYQKKMAALTPEQKRNNFIKSAYLAFTNNSIDAIVEAKAKNEKIKIIRNSGGGATGGKGNPPRSNNKFVSIDDIKL